MKAITVKVLPATNFRGKRAKATDGDNSVTVNWHYDDDKANYHTAAKALCAKLDWHGTLHGGHTKDGMVFVFAHASSALTI